LRDARRLSGILGTRFLICITEGFLRDSGEILEGLWRDFGGILEGFLKDPIRWILEDAEDAEDTSRIFKERFSVHSMWILGGSSSGFFSQIGSS